jgi:hypothetical protein
VANERPSEGHALFLSTAEALGFWLSLPWRATTQCPRCTFCAMAALDCPRIFKP